MSDLDRKLALLKKLREQRQGSATTETKPKAQTIPRVERSGPMPLSFGQERIWLLDRLMPGGNSFNMPFSLRLVGAFDVDALRRAIDALVERHESLRTTFVEVDGAPRQVIHDPSTVKLEIRDLGDLPEAEREQRAAELRDQLSGRPFDLETGPLYRATVLRLGDTEHHLIQVMHHIVSDGWSTGVLFRELRALLTAYTEGREPALEPLPIQYVDFVAWQRERLSGDYLEKLVDYWRDTLDSAAQTLPLATDRPRPAVPSNRGAMLSHAIGRPLAEALEVLARSERTSLFMVVLAAFDALMARLSGQDDVLVGSPVAGRQRLETEGVIGFFLNTLVLRTRVDRRQDFRTLLRTVRSSVLGATEHQEIPFEKLLEELRPERHLSQTPFFQVLFNMTNLPDLAFDLPGLRVEGLDYESIGSKFDFTLYVSENPKSDDQRLVLNLSYNAELFDRARMREMLDQYELLLEQFVAQPDRPIGEATLVTDRARRLLPDPTVALDETWRGTIAEGMLRHAAERPSAPAVRDVRTTTSYGDLADRSARIARRLLDAGLRRGDVVAIWSHRSAPLVEALLGVLRAGAAFTMLDPQYPIGRLLDYVQLAEPRGVVLLDDAGSMPEALAEALTERCVDADGDRRISLPTAGVEPLPEVEAGGDGVDPEIGPDDLAYIAFTSGSTGKPKTILGRHTSLSHFLPWLAERFGFGPDDRHALLSALSHDPLHRDVFMPLWFGASVVIPDPERIGEPGYLADWVEREGLTILNLVPAMLQLLVSTAPSGTALASLRHVFTVGDVLTRQDVDNLYRIAPNAICVNYYGSTETQRALSFVELPRPSSPESELDQSSELGTGGLGKAALPLGRGIEGVQLIVLDADGRQTGVGEPGEIFVRSTMLARGYADPAQTAERFLPNPFVADPAPNDRLYKTGDLGRYLPNGDVEFLGRADFQVQIRGFRIELQEIEVALQDHPAIGESVVLVRGEGEARFLTAYLVAADGAEVPEPRVLRHHLADRLPDYMIPTAWTVLAALPLTRTGKLDRRALPDPEPITDTARSAPPETDAEKALAAIWADVLGRESIGRHDHFFEIGGHSLLATRMLARVRESFGVDAPLRLVFEAPTLAAMAAALDESDERSAGAAQIARVERGGPLPVSFAQRRLWFLDQLEPDSSAYVLSAGIRLLGPLDRDRLGRALDRLVERHETLRTRIVTLDADPAQVIDPPRPQELPRVDLSDRDADAALAEARRRAGEETRRPMNLAEGPLLRTTLLHLADDDHVLLLSIHHIVSDGWSTGIFFRELSELYAADAEGREPRLPELSVQYADFAAWESETLAGEVLERRLDFWREHLDGAPDVLELPTDRPRPAQQTFVGARHRLRFSPELSEQIRDCSRQLGATPFMTLLSAWALLLGRHAGQDDVVVGTPVAHREHTELEGLIGFFANTLPLRARLAGASTFAELVTRLRPSVLDALAHQDLPFEKLVVELDVERDLAYSPVFQVMFSMQNLGGVDARLGDLRLTGLDTEYSRSQFDINLVLMEGQASEEPDAPTIFGGWMEYNTDLFDAATLDAYGSRLVHLLEQVTADPSRSLDTVGLLAPDERHRVLDTWNATARELPAVALHELVAERAAEHPDRPAVTGLGGPTDGTTWTYGELLGRARRLGHHLREAGARPDQLVGVLLHRSPEALATLLGILEAGAGYLPLDPAYPSDRLAYMVESSGATLVVTDGELPESTGLDALTESHGVRFVRLDAEASAIDARPDTAVDAAIDPENLAYAIYTSGSTGKPKGVQIPHRAIVNFLRSMAREPGLEVDDVLLSVTTLSFDIAGLELFLPLVVGARVVIADREITGDGLALKDALADPAHGTTVMQATPATWRMLVDAGWEGTDGLKILSGGEALPADLARELTRRSAELWNVYGPTETTVWSTTRRVDAGDESPHGGATVTVGFPIDNTTVYLLGSDGQPVPPGAVGELLIGGDGLARGYRGRGDLTAERFVPHPFGDGERLYRTGDLARHRMTSDGRGDLEFLGRIDHQVKVRGFRIELGEIESVLREHPAVDQAVVMARTDGGTAARLVAYVVAGDDAPPDDLLRAHLGGRLPEYMVPAIVVRLDRLPLTPNGKVDRKALPAPDVTATTDYVAPEGETETTLAAVWAEVLNIERVGRHDNFFALGGDSILVIQVVTRAKKAGVGLAPRDLFQQTDLAALARVAKALDPEPSTPAPSTAPDREDGIDVVGDLGDDELDDILGDLDL